MENGWKYSSHWMLASCGYDKRRKVEWNSQSSSQTRSNQTQKSFIPSLSDLLIKATVKISKKDQKSEKKTKFFSYFFDNF